MILKYRCRCCGAINHYGFGGDFTAKESEVTLGPNGAVEIAPHLQFRVHICNPALRQNCSTLGFMEVVGIMFEEGEEYEL